MDKANQILCRNLKVKDLDQVAETHKKAFVDTLLCAYGEKAIIKYYQWQMKPPNKCYAIGVFENDTLLGFTFSGVLSNAELFFIKKYLPYFIWHTISHPKLIFDKRVFNQIRKSMRYIKEYKTEKRQIKVDEEKMKEKSFGILSTAVAPDHQGHGIGKLLTEAVEKYARQNNYPTISMSVEKENTASIKLHEKLGYKKVVSDRGEWQGKMIKDLRN